MGWYPGDITEAVAMAATAGDPLGLPQDTPGAHGINDDRMTAFMRGCLGGVDGCDLQRLERQAKLVPAKPEYPRGTLCRTPQTMAAELDERRSRDGCMTGPIKMIMPTCSHGARR